MSVLLYYARVLGKAGRYDKAIEVQKKLIDILDPKADKEPHLSYMAVFYFQAGEKEKGKELFESLYQEAKNDIDELRDLAWYCQKHEVNLKEAQAWAERAVELSKDENKVASSMLLSFFPGSVLDTYADILFENGEIEKAIEVETEAYNTAIHENNINIYREKLEKYKAALK